RSGGRNPYCRMTSFSRDHDEANGPAWALAHAVNRGFKEHAQDRWQAQRDFIKDVHEDWIIGDTVFKGITVNRSERKATQRDDGDYRDGLGVMAVVEDGRYVGGELIFPQYRTAVDMRTGGVCLADVHEWHGNAPIVPKGKTFTRLSFIFYA